MPLFYFDIRTRRSLEHDDTGLELASAECAYLTACAAIPGLTAELLRRGDGPRGCAFVVADEAGHLLWEIPFQEILGRVDPPRRPDRRVGAAPPDRPRPS